jgi:hypothetical protein
MLFFLCDFCGILRIAPRNQRPYQTSFCLSGLPYPCTLPVILHSQVCAMPRISIRLTEHRKPGSCRKNTIPGRAKLEAGGHNRYLHRTA